MEIFDRTIGLIGQTAFEKLRSARVAVFGVGGVGGYVVEGLVRSGVRHITVIDGDVVSTTNINRQIIALHSTVGRKKVDVIKERALDIDPSCTVDTVYGFYKKGDAFDFENYDYVVDAIDDVSAKTDIICSCAKAGVKVICSMGTANHLSPLSFEIADVLETSVCPLAKAVRKKLKEEGLQKGKAKALFSTENPCVTKQSGPPCSIAFCPSVAGMIIASEVIKDLIK